MAAQDVRRTHCRDVGTRIWI